MVKKQSFLEHLIILLSVTIVVSWAVISLSHNTVYADDIVQDKLVVVGANTSGSWQYCYNGNETDYVSYVLGAPIDRMVNQVPVKWRLSTSEYSDSGKLTKIALTKTDTDEPVFAIEASNDNIGLRTSDWTSEMPPADEEPAIGDDIRIKKNGDRLWRGNYFTFSKMVFDTNGNAVTLYSHRNENYIEIEVMGATVDTNYSGYNRTLTLYFNGAEDGPVVPEEVLAVIRAIDEIGEITDSNYLEKESTVNAAKDAYYALESQDLKDQVTNYDTLTAAEESIASFKLAAAKTNAKGELDTLLAGKNEADYDADDWTALIEAISDGKDAIGAATTTAGVNDAKSDAEKAVSAIKTKAQKAEEELAAAKTKAKGELDTLLAGKNEADYDADDWTALTKAISDGKDAIDVATTTDGVNEAKSAAENTVAAIKTKKQKAAEKAEAIKKQKEAAKKYKVAGLKVTSKNRKFTISWKKTKGATGYQVQYRLNGSKKYKTLKTLTKTKVISKKLKLNKKYQFRVRTYTKVDGTKIYGVWTKVKTVKCRGRK